MTQVRNNNIMDTNLFTIDMDQWLAVDLKELLGSKNPIWNNYNNNNGSVW